MDLDLGGRHALVCGGSVGIGRAAAIELAALGANVTLLARREDALRDAVAIAQIEENQSAVVAHAVHPAAQFHFRARIGGAQLSACMCPHLHLVVPFS